MSGSPADESPGTCPPIDRPHPRRTSRIHPAEFLREELLPDYGLDASSFADRLHLPRERVASLIAEETPVDPEIALRLARLFDTSAQYWLTLQSQADLTDVRGRLRPELMQVRPMSDTGWDTSRSADTEDWARWVRRTSPAELLCTALADDAGGSLAEVSSSAGITADRIHELAAGVARFTLADDTGLSRALGLSPGYWLRAQAASGAAAGTEALTPELDTGERVRDALCRIEVAHDVRVLYAVESGSRAWGFASTDSDYDVRFIYAHRPEWYLSVQPRRDVIEQPLDHELDVSGWDVTKALGLFGKSNPPLFEWLRSPIIYLETGALAERLRDHAERFASPNACIHHYLHMAANNYREYLRSDKVWLKKYFYVLRPVLACSWIEAHDTLPPVEFELLVEDRLPNRLRPAVDDLLQRKRAGDELTVGPRIPEVSDFLDAELERLGNVARERGRGESPDLDELDAVLRSTLRQAWDSHV